MRILETAGDHVRKFGPARLTVVAIAHELGMSHANVYRYFPSKIGLLEAVTAHWLKPVEAQLRAVADGPDPARDKLERILEGLHRAYRDKLESDPQLFDVFVSFFHQRAALARKHRGKVQAEARRVLDEGIAAGAFANADPGRALTLVFDAAHRFIHPPCVVEDRDLPGAQLASRLERVLDSTFAVLARGATPAQRHVN
jgi:AcrR family transcriptional regulator